MPSMENCDAAVKFAPAVNMVTNEPHVAPSSVEDEISKTAAEDRMATT